ncbi:hypothetical protein CQ018_15405 [Arthrobacter sp. MYb227]|uniref:SpaH/EbpB family LPXTG-anchored major pilin n=1 Tax=Arthrobacter sp. MYb227 TaxID=1848601 RepID=UPI000CFBB459|nr:SpaH/EbpB family LPXTG-anchored major pilin [Arthrobacter sp. MYb227]PQZ89544.1 hypothetical protein CQ018_15405 [Arthrobacter sp. MYb227]
MAEIKNTWGKRALAGFGVLALASAGLLGGSTAASAATELGNIDQDAKGSINIHKHKHQNGTDKVQNPDGSSPALGSPLDGVEFTAFPITNVNLKTSEGWGKLQDVTLGSACELPADLTKGAEVAKVVTGSAGTAGQAKISELPVGAYLLCETAAPPEVVDRALPFIVTIPLPHNNGWLYDVNVYPKNGTAGIEKTITPEHGLTLGSVVEFPVKTDVPSVRADSSLTKYVISDTLDARLGSVGVTSVTLDGADVNVDYYDVLPADGVGNKREVVFNAAGLAWLKTQPEKQIVTTFQGTVIEIGDGAITNKATVFVNTPENENELVSKPVTTNWGDVKILKIDDSEAAKGLQGAEFQVYEAADPYATTCAATPAGDALNVNAEKIVTSGADGTIKIAGLFVSDSVNDPGRDSAFRCYVVKEIKAPAGFVTPTGDAAFTAVKVVKGQTAEGEYDGDPIVNKQQEVPELPLTGANGQMVMVIGGSALLLIAGGVVMLNRRRSANEQQN